MIVSIISLDVWRKLDDDVTDILTLHYFIFSMCPSCFLFNVFLMLLTYTVYTCSFQDESDQYEVTAMPTFVFFKSNKEVIIDKRRTDFDFGFSASPKCLI